MICPSSSVPLTTYVPSDVIVTVLPSAVAPDPSIVTVSPFRVMMVESDSSQSVSRSAFLYSTDIVLSVEAVVVTDAEEAAAPFVAAAWVPEPESPVPVHPAEARMITAAITSAGNISFICFISYFPPCSRIFLRFLLSYLSEDPSPRY